MHQHPGRFAFSPRTKEMPMNTLILQTLKPRNPLVSASRRRLAGVHRRGTGGMRQRQQQALQRELRDLDRQRHGP
jgi:hypothetical protein